MLFLHSSYGHSIPTYAIIGNRFQFICDHTVSARLCDVYVREHFVVKLPKLILIQLVECRPRSLIDCQSQSIVEVKNWSNYCACLHILDVIASRISHQKFEFLESDYSNFEATFYSISIKLPATCSIRPAMLSILDQALLFSPMDHRMMVRQLHYYSIVELQTHLLDFSKFPILIFQNHQIIINTIPFRFATYRIHGELG